MQTHIWSIELSMTNRVYLWCTSVWDCRVVMLETVMNSMENVFQLNKKNKPTYFLMTASFCLHGHSSSPRSKQAFSLSVRPAPAPLPCGNWYQNTLSRLCCLSARSDAQTSFSLSRPIPPFGVSWEPGAEGGGAHASQSLNPFLIDLSLMLRRLFAALTRMHGWMGACCVAHGSPIKEESRKTRRKLRDNTHLSFFSPAPETDYRCFFFFFFFSNSIPLSNHFSYPLPPSFAYCDGQA